MSTQISSTPGGHVQRRSIGDLLLTLPFILLFLIQLAHHELWRDELNVFGIAHASPTLGSLFNKLSYEGHPSLWYVLIWIASRWISTPVVLKVVEAIIGTAIYLMIGLKSPFSRIEKILLFLSYFVSFEYTVLSRTYGLCFLFVLVYAYRRVLYPDQSYSCASLLGLIANSDTTGLILSGALAAEYLYNQLFVRCNRTGAAVRRLALAGLLYAFAIGFCYWTLRPARDISWPKVSQIAHESTALLHFASGVVSYVAIPWVPIIVNGYPAVFWNPYPLLHPIAYFLCFAAVCIGYLLLFRKDLDLLAMIALTATVALVFASLVYMGHVRNFGVTFMAFLVALWIQRSRIRRAPVLSYVFLSVSAAGGIAAAVAQWHHPFSNTQNAVRWLKANHLENRLLVGTPDTSIASLAEELDRPEYFLDCNCIDTFQKFSNRRDSYDYETMFPTRLEIAARTLSGLDLLLVTVKPVSAAEGRGIAGYGLKISLLQQFTGSESWGEDYYFYRVTRDAQPRP